ncbi:hypothetical protein E2320_005685 [Naja naja]|nr:hypothetical protein E2320_005685 [Naja naja]
MASTCEDTKHQLAAQAEKLEKHQQEQTKQVEELKKKLAQQEKAVQTHQQKAKVREEGLRSEMKQLKEKTADLQAQLVQKEQAIEHYKTQNQELLQKLKGLEHLEKENAELKAESERLAKELQHTALQATESELSLKNVTSQVRVLQAQLREQGKVQAALETLKGRETFRQGSADISTDSLDRKSRRSLSESGPVESSKRESLESLYFTPIPTRSRSKLENSIDSIGNITLDSGRKALSGRRRTTQLINITMIKKHPKLEPLESTNESFVSLRSSSSGESGQESVKTRLRSAAASSSSTRSLASLPPQESLTRLAASSPDGASGHAALKSLPGYRPATRSSLRHSQDGGANTGESGGLGVGTLPR